MSPHDDPAGEDNPTGGTGGSDVGDHDWLRTPLEDLAAIARQYDGWADGYDRDLTSWRYDAPAVVAQIVADHRNGAGPAGAVLDAGCGTGLVGAALAELGVNEVDGLDVSAASLAVAATRNVYRSLVVHDLATVPYPVVGATYVAAVCVGVLSYLPDTGTVLRELARAVRPGGLVVVTQRDDLWDPRRMEAVLDRLHPDGPFTAMTWSDARPYMPGNPDFADDIGVRYVTATVGPG